MSKGFRDLEEIVETNREDDIKDLKGIIEKRDEIFKKTENKVDLIEGLNQKVCKSYAGLGNAADGLHTFANLPMSELIEKRIQFYNAENDDVTYKANDNISKFIRPEELEKLQAEVEGKIKGLLKSLVIDIDNDHNTNDTARRVAKMFVNEIFEGRYKTMPKVTHFPNVTGYKSIYTTGPISIKSTCAHHFQNITGKCWVGIIPENSVIGLSKFNRIIHWLAHRPQIQEELTSQIADELEKYSKTKHVAVVLKAEHHCMTMRGVREHESDMTTAVMRGAFMDDHATRNEFYQLLATMKGIPNGN